VQLFVLLHIRAVAAGPCRWSPASACIAEFIFFCSFAFACRLFVTYLAASGATSRPATETENRLPCVHGAALM
jgi:hypothetical protein